MSSDIAAIRWQFTQLLRTVPGSGRILQNGADAELKTTVAAGCWTPCQSRNSNSETAWMRIPGQYELDMDKLQSLSPCSTATMETPSRMSCQRRRG